MAMAQRAVACRRPAAASREGERVRCAQVCTVLVVADFSFPTLAAGHGHQQLDTAAVGDGVASQVRCSKHTPGSS